MNYWHIGIIEVKIKEHQQIFYLKLQHKCVNEPSEIN